MDSSETIVAGIKLRSDRPTSLTFAAIRGWVIWQFPQREKRGFRGAVRPPQEGCSWYPAIVVADSERVRVFGHLDAHYESPEAAAAYFGKPARG